MAAREHRVSRRALLGAACALPLARHPGLVRPEEAQGPEPAAPTPAPVRAQSDEAWQRNLALLRRAEARLAALAHEPDEDLYDNANAVFFHALKKLVRTPAPDLPALALKIELAVDHEVAELTGGQACLAVLKRDAHRIAMIRSS